MELSISNIAWTEEQDETVYEMLAEKRVHGLEIAPTRIFQNLPYEKMDEAREWSTKLKYKYGLEISSMQSIWYGRQEEIFKTPEERQSLARYTRQAIDFAEMIGCKNLVLGCPRNRNVPEGWGQEQIDGIAIPFFREIGEYAAQKGIVIALEANPVLYGTNYINNTVEALKLVKRVGSSGFFLNLDVGTIIAENEDLTEACGNVNLIHHVHISEPALALIQERKLHSELIQILAKEKYCGFISIEMKKQENIVVIEHVMEYARGLLKNDN